MVGFGVSVVRQLLDQRSALMSRVLIPVACRLGAGMTGRYARRDERRPVLIFDTHHRQGRSIRAGPITRLPLHRSPTQRPPDAEAQLGPLS